MQDLENATQDYLAFRDRVLSAQIATLGGDGSPEASYAPFVRRDNNYFLFLSELASHTRNLQHNPTISLLLIEDEAQAGNVFARKRISLQGRADFVGREESEFAPVLSEFHLRFGQVMELIEPLPDFRLFRVTPASGRFVRGFAQAFELSGEALDQLSHIDPRR